MDKTVNSTTPHVSLGKSIFVFAFLLVCITVIVLIYKGPISFVMMLGAVVAAAVAISCGYKYKVLETAVLDAIRGISFACVIYMVIGILMGAWIVGGIIPSMIYYGLKLLNVKIFFAMSMIICSVFSVSTGSSWSTVGTVGIALLGVGTGLGVPLPMVAGCIVSGAYFGDKLSPISDTTNIAASASGTDVFTHMRHMLHTTLPAYFIAFVAYLILGFRYSGTAGQSESVRLFMDTLAENFVISPLLILPVFMIILVIVLKIPAIPGLLLTGFIGMLCALFVQGMDIISIMKACYSGVSMETGVAEINRLVNRGGMTSMLSTICLLLASCCFTGVIRASGMLSNIVNALMGHAKTDSQIILTTQATAFFNNCATGDSNVAILLTASMYHDFYKEKGLHPKNLSRACEDMCTMTSSLIPWATSAAYISGALGIASTTYLPFVWFNLTSIVLAIIVAFTGKDIPHIKEGEVVED